MEIEKFNLLIGEQATGKSTIAKSIYFFRTIKTKVIDYLTQIYDTNSYNNVVQDDIWFDKAIKSELKNIFVKLFGYSWDLNPKFHMKYDYADDIWIIVALKKGKRYISITYSPKLISAIKNLQEEVRELYYNNKTTMSLSLALANAEVKRHHEMIARRVGAIFCDDKETYYIPAGRSILTVMSNNRATMNSVTNLDLVTEMFMMLIDRVRDSFTQGVKKAHLLYSEENRKFDENEVANLIVSIEKGEYFYSGGREFLKISDEPEHPITINFASSGQQEVLWLLNFVYVLMLRQENAFLIVEEPEAHIYPLLQKLIIEFIAMFSNMQDSSVLITTHSPYILNAVNNLYYAGVLENEGSEKQVHKIINKNFIIHKGELAAYKLLNVCKDSEEKSYVDLLDDEEREIRASLIDDVSSQINEDYTALYDIELDNE